MPSGDKISKFIGYRSYMMSFNVLVAVVSSGKNPTDQKVNREDAKKGNAVDDNSGNGGNQDDSIAPTKPNIGSFSGSSIAKLDTVLILIIEIIFYISGEFMIIK